MKVFSLSLFMATFFLLVSGSSFASSRVSVSNNVNTEGNYRENSSTHTEIRIEQNGEVRTYSSDKNEDVNFESEDGKVKVRINNSPSAINNETEEGIKVEEKPQDRVRESNYHKDNFVKEEIKREHNNPKALFSELGESIRAQLEKIKGILASEI